jgi:hypothetical protein
LTFPCRGFVNLQDIAIFMPLPDPIICCYLFFGQQQGIPATQDFDFLVMST